MSFTLPTPSLQPVHTNAVRFQRAEDEWLLEFPAPDKLWSANTRPGQWVETKLKRAWRGAAARAGARINPGEGPWIIVAGLPFQRRNASWDPHNWTSTVIKSIIDGLGPVTWTKTRKGEVIENPGAEWWSNDDVSRIKVIDAYAIVCPLGKPMTVAVHGLRLSG